MSGADLPPRFRTLIGSDNLLVDHEHGSLSTIGALRPGPVLSAPPNRSISSRKFVASLGYLNP